MLQSQENQRNLGTTQSRSQAHKRKPHQSLGATPRAAPGTSEPKKSRDQLLEEWRAKKGKTPVKSRTRPAAPVRRSVAVPPPSSNRHPHANLVKMKLKMAKEIALRGTAEDLQAAREKLRSLVGKDPLIMHKHIETMAEGEKKRRFQQQLTQALECNAAIFHFSEYWCTRAFVEWSVGDLESAIILLDLAQKSKAQPLHPILESIQFLLKLVKKEASLLVAQPSESVYCRSAQPLIEAIERLQRFSLVSCVACQRLSELHACLTTYQSTLSPDSYDPPSRAILSPSVRQQVQERATPRRRASSIRLSSGPVTDDMTSPPVVVPQAIEFAPMSDNEDDSHDEEDEDDEEDLLDVQVPMEPSEEEDDHHSEELEIANAPESEHVDEASEDEESSELNLELSGCSSEEVLLELSEVSSSDDGEMEAESLTQPEPVETPRPVMMIGDDEETESGSEIESEDDASEGDIHLLRMDDHASSCQEHDMFDPPSPEFLPNPVGLSMFDDPLSPRPMRRIPQSPRATPQPSTPGTASRLNTPLMNKLRQKKRSSVFLPSTSPYLRNSQPQRVNARDFHQEMKKSATTQEAIDALALYRRESVLYKTSVNDMVDNLFADEELDEDFSAIEAHYAPLQPTTPMRSGPPPELLEMLSAKEAERQAALPPRTPPTQRKGSIVVVTPAKTSKRERELLNSDKKVTNLRRSARKNKFRVPTKEDRTHMLEECGYSYQANRNILDEEDVMMLDEGVLPPQPKKKSVAPVAASRKPRAKRQTTTK